MISLLFLFGAALVATLQVRVPRALFLGVVALFLLLAAGTALLSASFAAPIAVLSFVTAGIAIASARTPGPPTPFAGGSSHVLLPLLAWFLLLAALQAEPGAHLGLDPAGSALRALACILVGAGLWFLFVLHVRAGAAGLLAGCVVLLYGPAEPALPLLQLPILAADGGSLQLLQGSPDGILQATPLVVSWAWPALVLALLLVLLAVAPFFPLHSEGRGARPALRQAAALGALALGAGIIACTWIGLGVPDSAGLHSLHSSAVASAHPDAQVILHPEGPAGGLSVAFALLHAWPLWTAFVLLFARPASPCGSARDSALPGSVLLCGAGALLLVADLQAGWSFVATAPGAALAGAGLATMGIAFAAGPRRGAAPLALFAGVLAPWLVFRLVFG